MSHLTKRKAVIVNKLLATGNLIGHGSQTLANVSTVGAKAAVGGSTAKLKAPHLLLNPQLGDFKGLEFSAVRFARLKKPLSLGDCYRTICV